MVYKIPILCQRSDNNLLLVIPRPVCSLVNSEVVSPPPSWTDNGKFLLARSIIRGSFRKSVWRCMLSRMFQIQVALRTFQLLFLCLCFALSTDFRTYHLLVSTRYTATQFMVRHIPLTFPCPQDQGVSTSQCLALEHFPVPHCSEDSQSWQLSHT